MNLQKELKKHFLYNEKTGEIIRLTRKNSNGSYDKDGYLIIKYNKKQYKSHRLAWFLFYGEWPQYNIDHINGNRLDNRIENLRDVEQKINVHNTKRQPNPHTNKIGIHLDNCTKGLVAKYTTSINGKKLRFRNLNDAIKIRQMEGLPC